MNILALDSADGSASVALLHDGGCELVCNAQMRDSLSWMQTEVAQLRSDHFKQWDALDSLACCVGPGGFTGVRVAVGYAQGLGIATGLPCVAVNSLDGLASNLQQHLLAHSESASDAEIWLALDARMQELYAGRYRMEANGQLIADGPMQLIGAQALRDQLGTEVLLAGPGFEAWPDLFSEHSINGIRLDAAAIARVAAQRVERISAADLQPVYLRNNVAQTLQQRGVKRPPKAQTAA